MSILEDFLTKNLSHLPNDTQNELCNTQVHGGASPCGTHRKRHQNQSHLGAAPVHSAMHGQHSHHPAAPDNPTANQSTQTATHGDAQTYNNAQHCIPCHQKNARDFLLGNTPGVMAFYAPEEQRYADRHPCAQPANIIANTRPDNATVEDAETVKRLVEWREDASY